MSTPNLPAPRQQVVDKFDPDLWVVMNRADEQLLEDEVLNGPMAGKFVYSFSMGGGSKVAGVSVVGARHLARIYGGLQHRLVASIEKRGPLFKSVSYPSPGIPMQVTTFTDHNLADDPDYYQALIEIKDIKTGNVVQSEKIEMRFEKKRDGGVFERQHYAQIAQSKAFRNAVLSIVPQDVLLKFMEQCIKLGQSADITQGVIDAARQKVASFAAAKGVAFDRSRVYALGMDEISGLRDAIAVSQEAFETAAARLGVMVPAITQEPAPQKRKPTTLKKPADEPAPPPVEGPAENVDPDTGEVSGAELFGDE